MRRTRVLLVGGPVTDVAVDDDERWPVGARAERADRPLEECEVVGITDTRDVPAVAGEARRDVLAEGERRGALDRHVVVVVEPAQICEAEMARQRGRLARETLHHVAVAGEGVDVVVEHREVRPVEVHGQPPGGDRHPDARRDPLAEGTGGRLHAGGPAVLGMPRALAVELPEVADVVERHGRFARHLVVGVHRLRAGQVEERVEKHRGVPGREDEAVAVRPDRIRGIEAEDALPEAVGERRHPHRCPGMTRVRLLHGVDRERANRIDAQLIEVLRHARAPMPAR